MSFLYPRTVSISRPTQPDGVGAVGYGGETKVSEMAIASGISANIQLNKQHGNQVVNLPGDGARTLWKILMPAYQAPLGLIQSRDIVTDDAGVRYQVVAPYWNSLGHNLLCERLEA